MAQLEVRAEILGLRPAVWQGKALEKKSAAVWAPPTELRPRPNWVRPEEKWFEASAPFPFPARLAPRERGLGRPRPLPSIWFPQSSAPQW